MAVESKPERVENGFHVTVGRWCCVKRTNKTSSVVLVALKHVSIQEFEQHMDCFPFLAETFSEVGYLIA